MSWKPPKGIITRYGTIILSKDGKISCTLFCPKTGFKTACNVNLCPYIYCDQRYLHLCGGVELQLNALTDLREDRKPDDIVNTCEVD